MKITDFMAWVADATPFQTWWIAAGFFFQVMVIAAAIVGVIKLVG